MKNKTTWLSQNWCHNLQTWWKIRKATSTANNSHARERTINFWRQEVRSCTKVTLQMFAGATVSWMGPVVVKYTGKRSQDEKCPLEASRRCSMYTQHFLPGVWTRTWITSIGFFCLEQGSTFQLCRPFLKYLINSGILNILWAQSLSNPVQSGKSAKCGGRRPC